MSNASDFIIENGVLKKYVGKGEHVVIPEGVTIIGSSAFSFCETLRSVEIPDSVEEIGSSAFAYCKQLVSATIPVGVKKVGYSAFAYCAKLVSVTIPDSIETLGITLFEKCDALETVQVSETVLKRLKNPPVKDVFMTDTAVYRFLNQGIVLNPTLEKTYLSFLNTKKQRGKYIADCIFSDDLEQLKKLMALQKKVPEEELTDYIAKAQKRKAKKVEAYLCALRDGKDDSQAEMKSEKTDLADSGTGNMSAAEAEKVFLFTKKDAHIAITGLKDVYEQREGSRYRRYFHKWAGPKVVVPDAIDGTKVSKVAVGDFPDESIVYCNGEVFGKLSRVIKVNTTIAYLKDETGFSTEQVEKMGQFLKKYADDVAGRMAECDEISAYRKFVEVAKPKRDILETLIGHAQGKPEILAYLMECAGKNTAESAPEKLSLEPAKKVTVAELKKKWTFRKVMVYGTDEEYISLTRYKGNEAEVTIPAYIGKLPVRELGGNAFEGNQYVQRIIPEDPDLEIAGPIGNCPQLADPQGFIVLPAGDRMILAGYVGPEDIQSIKIPDGVTENVYGVFQEMSLRVIEFPVGYKKIGRATCMNCRNLQHVQIPESVEFIGRMAFTGCRSLVMINIPRSVAEIEVNATGPSTTVIRTNG